MSRCLERQSTGGAYLCAARVLAPCAPNSWWCRAQAAHHSARSCCPETSLSRMIKLNNNNRSLHTALHVSHIWAPHLLDHMRCVPGTVLENIGQECMSRNARSALRKDEGRSSHKTAATRVACVSLELERRTERGSRALLFVAARVDP